MAFDHARALAPLRLGRARRAFGLCFEFRYASGVLPAGASLWYLWQSKGRLSLFAGLTLGALLALAIGGVADWWGYGQVTTTAYWYVYQNFVLGRANDFGTSPFFAYLYLPLTTAGVMAPLVLALLVATVTAWLTRRRSVLTWASAPYVMLLSIAPHKEVRFLFPLVPFLPFFVTFTFFSPCPFARASPPSFNGSPAAFGSSSLIC